MDRREFIKNATMAAAGMAVVASPVSAMLNDKTGQKALKVLLVNGSPRIGTMPTAIPLPSVTNDLRS